VHTKPRNYTKHKQVEARLKEQKRKRKKKKKNKMPNLELLVASDVGLNKFPDNGAKNLLS